MVATHRRDVATKGQGDAHDITDLVSSAVAESACAAGLVTINWPTRDPGGPVTTIIGLALAQAVLCAYAAVLSRGRLAWRWPLSALGVGLASLLAVGCLNSKRPYADDALAVAH